MSNGATLTSTGTAGALVQLTGSSLFSTAALSMTNSTMTLAGPFATVTNVGAVDPSLVTATLKTLGLNLSIGPDVPTFLLDKSTLTSSGTGALIQLTHSDIDTNSNFIRLVNGSTMTLAGPLLSVSQSSIFNGDPAAMPELPVHRRRKPGAEHEHPTLPELHEQQQPRHIREHPHPAPLDFGHADKADPGWSTVSATNSTFITRRLGSVRHSAHRLNPAAPHSPSSRERSSCRPRPRPSFSW